jgi:hypothetical protein
MYGRLYSLFKLVNGGFVMRYANLETRQWTAIDFGLKFSYYKIVFLNQKDLVIYTQKSTDLTKSFSPIKTTVYKISVR